MIFNRFNIVVILSLKIPPKCPEHWWHLVNLIFFLNEKMLKKTKGQYTDKNWNKLRNAKKNVENFQNKSPDQFKNRIRCKYKSSFLDIGSLWCIFLILINYVVIAINLKWSDIPELQSWPVPCTIIYRLWISKLTNISNIVMPL